MGDATLRVTGAFLAQMPTPHAPVKPPYHTPWSDDS